MGKSKSQCMRYLPINERLSATFPLTDTKPNCDRSKAVREWIRLHSNVKLVLTEEEYSKLLAIYRGEMKTRRI